MGQRQNPGMNSFVSPKEMFWTVKYLLHWSSPTNKALIKKYTTNNRVIPFLYEYFAKSLGRTMPTNSPLGWPLLLISTASKRGRSRNICSTSKTVASIGNKLIVLCVYNLMPTILAPFGWQCELRLWCSQWQTIHQSLEP